MTTTVPIMHVYGIDPGLKNLGIVKLSTVDENRFTIERLDLVDISRDMHNFHVFFKQHMLEVGDVYIEYQFRNGRTKDHSHFIHGYLTGMMTDKRVHLKQSRDKFKVARDLGLMPKEHGDLKVYKNRKRCSEHILNTVLGKLSWNRTPHGKMDDIADALLYALWALRDRSPGALACIGDVSHMQPLGRRMRIEL